jgi:hypothetical protein
MQRKTIVSVGAINVYDIPRTKVRGCIVILSTFPFQHFHVAKMIINPRTKVRGCDVILLSFTLNTFNL